MWLIKIYVRGLPALLVLVALFAMQSRGFQTVWSWSWLDTLCVINFGCFFPFVAKRLHFTGQNQPSYTARALDRHDLDQRKQRDQASDHDRYGYKTKARMDVQSRDDAVFWGANFVLFVVEILLAPLLFVGCLLWQTWFRRR